MRRLLIAWTALGFVACGGSTDTLLNHNHRPVGDAGLDGDNAGGTSGCVVDTECKGSRVCDNGRCVEPTGSGGGGNGGATIGNGGSTSSGGTTIGSGGTLAIAGAGGAAGSAGALAGGAAGAGDGGGGAAGADASAGGASTDGSVPCLAIKGQPENIVVYRDATVTDTITVYNPVALFLMVDRSGSMITGFPPPASADSWANATAAVTSFVSDPQTQGIEIGLGTFPYGANNTADCSGGSDCGTPVVPIAPLPENGPATIQGMQAQTPSSPIAQTPTECGLRGMVNECLQFMTQSPGEPCVGVLITDGTPTQCDTNAANLQQIVKDGHDKGVTTFVLGLPGSDITALNALASVGGTNAAIDLTSGGSQAFIDALANIRQEVGIVTTRVVSTQVTVATTLPCEWGIPPGPSGSTDFSKVNLEFVAQNSSHETLRNVASLGDCTKYPNDGWYYDNPQAPTTMKLCPATCTRFTTLTGTFDVLYGCPQLRGP